MNKSRKYYIATLIFGILMIAAFFFEFYLLSAFLFWPTVILPFFGYWKQRDERTIKDYNDFIDMSDFSIGMDMHDVMMKNSKYVVTRVYDEKTLEPNNICPSCGAHTHNGKCSYCGGIYDTSKNISVLEYDCIYGARIFEFDSDGKVIKIKKWAYPVERFLSSTN